MKLSLAARARATIEKPWGRAAIRMGAFALVSASVFALLDLTVLPLVITSNSMAPGIVRGDFCVASYDKTIHEGDIIVFHYPRGSSRLAIKRAVALAGECVPSVPPLPLRADEEPPPAPPPCASVVPADSVYVIGDNVRGSIDSRTFGPVASNEIVGKVLFSLPTGSRGQRR